MADRPDAKDTPIGVAGEVEDPLDVLDLPQVYSKPNAQTLLSVLEDLRIRPSSWETVLGNGRPRTHPDERPLSKRKQRKINENGVPDYLTRIVSSSLVWLKDDEEKEQIWQAASQRLSERSGRTGMGAITRTFHIPLRADVGLAAGSNASPDCAEVALKARDATGEIELILHEPALTADNLGLKTWASSYLLAQRLCSLQHLVSSEQKFTILELGAGTGLVGLSAAAVYQTEVILTDLPDIVPNLDANACANAFAIGMHGGRAQTAVLDWHHPEAFNLPGGPQLIVSGNFMMILVADPIYSAEHPLLLVETIAYHLSRDSNAIVVVEMPVRAAYATERLDFRHRMGDVGLTIVDEGEETGIDDWTDASGDAVEVRCWWSVWTRQQL